MEDEQKNRKLLKNLIRQQKMLYRIARILQGTSKCAAVYINCDGALLVARNDINEKSMILQDTQYRQYIETQIQYIKQLCSENVSENDQKNAVSSFVMSENKQNTSRLRQRLKDFVACGRQIDKSDLKSFSDCQALELQGRRMLYEKFVEKIQKYFKKKMWAHEIKRAVLLCNNFPIITNCGSNVHAEMRVVDQIILNEFQEKIKQDNSQEQFLFKKEISEKQIHIGISLKTCAECNPMIEFLEILSNQKLKINFYTNDSHNIKNTNWCLPDFLCQEKISGKLVITKIIYEIQKIDPKALTYEPDKSKDSLITNYLTQYSDVLLMSDHLLQLFKKLANDFLQQKDSRIQDFMNQIQKKKQIFDEVEKELSQFCDQYGQIREILDQQQDIGLQIKSLMILQTDENIESQFSQQISTVIEKIKIRNDLCPRKPFSSQNRNLSLSPTNTSDRGEDSLNSSEIESFQQKDLYNQQQQQQHQQYFQQTNQLDQQVQQKRIKNQYNDLIQRLQQAAESDQITEENYIKLKAIVDQIQAKETIQSENYMPQEVGRIEGPEPKKRMKSDLHQ